MSKEAYNKIISKLQKRNNLDDFENFKKEIVRYVNKYIA